MRPKRPRTELKISTTRILTNLYNSLASMIFQIDSCWERLQCGIGSIGESRTTTVDSDGNTADEVAQADGETSPE